MMDDEKIIELFFQRSEQGIRELDRKYGKLCRSLAYRIVNDRQDAEEWTRSAVEKLRVMEARNQEAARRLLGG